MLIGIFPHQSGRRRRGTSAPGRKGIGAAGTLRWTAAALATAALTVAQNAWADTQYLPLQQCGMGRPYCADIAANGRWIFTGGSAGIYMRDIATGEVVRRYRTPRIRVNVSALSSQGDLLLSADNTFGTSYMDIGAKLWQTETGRLLREFPNTRGPVALSRDAARVVTGALNPSGMWLPEIHLWEVNNPELPPKVLSIPGWGPGAAAFTPNGLRILATGGTNDQVWALFIFDADGGSAPLRTVPLGDYPVDIAMSDDGSTFLLRLGATDPGSNFDGVAQLWQYEPSDAVSLLRTFTRPSRIFCSDLSGDGQYVLTGCEDGNINLWRSDNATAPIKSFSGHAATIRAVAFSKNGESFVSVDYANNVRVWNIETGGSVLILSDYTDNFATHWISSDDTQALSTIGSEGVFLVNPLTGQIIRRVLADPSQFRACSPDGQRLAVVSDDRLRILDVGTGVEIASLAIVPTVVAFMPDTNELLAGYGGDFWCRLYNIGTGVVVRSYSVDPGLRSIVISPDGSRFLLGYDSATLLYEKAQPGRVLTFPRSMGPLDHARPAWSPTADRIVIAGPDVGPTGPHTNVQSK